MQGICLWWRHLHHKIRRPFFFVSQYSPSNNIPEISRRFCISSTAKRLLSIFWRSIVETVRSFIVHQIKMTNLYRFLFPISMYFCQHPVYLVVKSLALLEVVDKKFGRRKNLSSALGSLHWSKLQSMSDVSRVVRTSLIVLNDDAKNKQIISFDKEKRWLLKQIVSLIPYLMNNVWYIKRPRWAGMTDRPWFWGFGQEKDGKDGKTPTNQHAIPTLPESATVMPTPKRLNCW